MSSLYIFKKEVIKLERDQRANRRNQIRNQEQRQRENFLDFNREFYQLDRKIENLDNQSDSVVSLPIDDNIFFIA